MTTNNSIADNLKKYHKYLELQKTDNKNKYIYNYKVAHYRKLLQEGGVKLNRLDTTPLHTITNTIRQIDEIIGDKPMRGGGNIFDERLKNLSDVIKELSKVDETKQAELQKKQTDIIDKIKALQKKSNETDEEKTKCNVQIDNLMQELKKVRDELALLNADVDAAGTTFDKQLKLLAEAVENANKLLEDYDKMFEGVLRAIDSPT